MDKEHLKGGWHPPGFTGILPNPSQGTQHVCGKKSTSRKGMCSPPSPSLQGPWHPDWTRLPLVCSLVFSIGADPTAKRHTQLSPMEPSYNALCIRHESDFAAIYPHDPSPLPSISKTLLGHIFRRSISTRNFKHEFSSCRLIIVCPLPSFSSPSYCRVFFQGSRATLSKSFPSTLIRSPPSEHPWLSVHVELVAFSLFLLFIQRSHHLC